MSAFAVFFLQSPSWLSCQRALQDEKGRSNALTLFGIVNVPTDNHVRRLLDPASPELLRGAFRGLLGLLKGCGALERYRVLGGRTPVALDGTDFHSSEKISCPGCLVTRHRDGRTVFSHKAVTPVIVAPGVRQAVPLRPEFVAPQDGAEKQDCELNASKRWLDDMAPWLREARAVLLGDDLYAHGPFCRKVLLHGLHFIFTCIRESHKAAYGWLDLLEPGDFQSAGETRREADGHRRTWAVRFAKGVPLSGEDGAPRRPSALARGRAACRFLASIHALQQQPTKNHLCNGVKIRIAVENLRKTTSGHKASIPIDFRVGSCPAVEGHSCQHRHNPHSCTSTCAASQ